MAKSFKCPNCGSASRSTISDTEFKCIHCETIFYDTSKEDIKKAIAEQVKNNRDSRQDAMAASYAYASKMRRTILIVVITVMLIGIGFSVYMVNKTVSEVNEQTEKIQQEVQESIKESTSNH